MNRIGNLDTYHTLVAMLMACCADGATFVPIGEPFTARKVRWIGAKAGIFAGGSRKGTEMGHADFD